MGRQAPYAAKTHLIFDKIRLGIPLTRTITTSQRGKTHGHITITVPTELIGRKVSILITLLPDSKELL